MEYSIHRFDLVGSTNDIATQMVQEGAPEGAVIVARGQRAGRGRRGRNWTSPLGGGLYLSVILRPPIPLADIWQVGFMASVAVAEAVEQIAEIKPHIKWPNDILIRDRKVAGILIELPIVAPGVGSARRSGEVQLGSRPVIVGIGVNVNIKNFPPELQHTATSIALAIGQSVAVSEVESALLSSLDRWYSKYIKEGFESVMNMWTNYDCTVGRKIRIDLDGRTIDGTVEQVRTVSGDIVVRCSDGTIVALSAGDILLDERLPD